MTAEVCFLHPERVSIERCEVCQRPVCSSCLWYAESGERLCRVHGEWWREQGKTVTEGEAYSAAGVFSELQTLQTQLAMPTTRARYMGNDPDLYAGLALLCTLILCGGCSGFSYFFPCLGIVFALLALTGIHNAHDSKRTRTFAYIALALCVMMALILVGVVGFFIVIAIINP